MTIRDFETLNICSFFSLILFFATGRNCFLYASVILIFLSIFVKPAGRLVASGWLRLSVFLGTINSKIILTVLFFCLLTPLALIRRLFQSDLLWLRKPDLKSYWKDREKRFNKKDLENLW